MYTANTCPDVGEWRAWLDGEPVGASQCSDAHLAQCVVCKSLVAELQVTAGVAARALASLPAGAAPQAERFRQRLAPARLVPPATLPANHRWPLGWRQAVAAAAAVALLGGLLTPEGQAAASQALAQFRGQRLAVVSFDPSSMGRPVGQLERLGSVQGTPPGRSVSGVATVAEAAARLGVTVKQPEPSTLPAGLPASPAVQVTQPSELTFTFDRDRARDYFRSVGRPDLTLPDDLHGNGLRTSVPGVIMLEYRPQQGRAPLAIIQTGELTASAVGGVSLDRVRDYLLSVPGLPPEVTRQLQAIQDWRNTLPIPVPVDKVSWQPVTVAGGPGLLFAERSGLGSAIIWQRDGRTYGVVGPYSSAELQRVANGLR
ncbi:MAG: hypothetical protein U0821_19770 [Chloroflexota bacterium]